LVACGRIPWKAPTSSPLPADIEAEEVKQIGIPANKDSLSSHLVTCGRIPWKAPTP
jgi:hypothetical protein